MKKFTILILWLILTTSWSWGQCTSYTAQLNVINTQSSIDTVFLCQGDSAQLWASVGGGNLIDTLQVEWTWGEGSLSIGDTGVFTYTDPGIYTVFLNMNSPSGCSPSNSNSVYVIVSDSSWFAQTDYTDTVCLSSPILLLPKPRFDTISEKCAVTEPDTLFLPDGSGVSYSSSIVVNCYSSGATIGSADFIESICLDIEHSWAADLKIELVSPDGTTITIQEPPGGYFIGEPVDMDNSNPIPGIPYTYCFLENNSTYGLMDGSDTQYISYINQAGFSESGSQYPAGTYDTEDSYAGLIGSLINGTWTLIITDQIGGDNGYLFSWSINFNANLLTTSNNFYPDVDQSTWTPTSGSFLTQTDTSALWQPSDTGWASIDYHFTDVYGCSLDTVFDVYVRDLPEPKASTDTICFDDPIPYIVNRGNGATQWYYPTTNTLFATGDSVQAPQNLTPGTNEIYLRSALEGCIVWDTAIVYKHAQLNATFTNPPVILGTIPSISATVSGGSGQYTYSWSPAFLFVDPLQSSSSLTFAITNDALVQLAVTDIVTGCTRTFNQNIDIISPLDVGAGANQAICLGDSIFLNGNITAQTDPIDSTNWLGTGLDTALNGFWFTPTQSGNFTFTFTAYSNGVADSDQKDVAVDFPPTAGSNLIDTICASELKILNTYLDGSQTTGGTWFNDQGVSVTSGGIGDYTYVVSQGSCPADSAHLNIFSWPNPNIQWSSSLPDTICSNDLPFDFKPYVTTTSLFYGSDLNTNGELDSGFTGTTELSFTYSFGNGCSAGDTATVFVMTNDTLVVPDTLQYCAGPDTILFSSFFQAGAQILDSPGSTDTLFLDSMMPGVYSYTVRSSSGYCSKTDTGYVEIVNVNGITWAALPSLCLDDSPLPLNFASPAGGIYSGSGVINGFFDPSIAGIGDHYIRYEELSNGCLSVDSSLVTVNPAPQISVGTVPDSICLNAAPISLTVAPGTTWSGTGVNGSTFDPSVAGLGNHTLYVQVTDGLSGCMALDSISMHVADQSAPVIFAPDTLCASNAPIALLSDIPGGSYSGPGVSADSLDPAGLSGIVSINYTVSNSLGCTAQAQKSIWIDAGVTPTVAPPPTYCSYQSPINLNLVSPTGGQYSGPGVVGNQFDPGAAGAGVHTIQYTFASPSGCPDSVQISIQVDSVVQAPTLSIPDSLCISDHSAYFPNNNNAALYVDGIFADSLIPSSLTAGSHIWSTFILNGVCSDSTGGFFWIEDLPNISIVPPSDLCESDGPMPLPTGNPAAGSFSGPGIISGQFDPAVAGVGAHVLTYTASNSVGCTDSLSFLWTVWPNPALSISQPAVFCENESAVAANWALPAGGIYSGTGLTSTSGQTYFDPAAAGPGTHLWNYQYTNAQGCTADTTFTVEVQATPNVQLSTFASICENDSSFALNSGSPPGGVYSGPGVLNGYFTPTSTGSFPIVYTYTDSIGCSESVTEFQLVNPAPPHPSISQYSYNLVCDWGFHQYQWLLNGDTIPGANSITHKPVIPGVYTVIMTNNYGCSSYSDPFLVTTVSIAENGAPSWTVFPNPTNKTLRVDGQAEVSSWSVLDISGRVVISGNGTMPEVIDVAFWSSGKYFMRISTDRTSTILPFVVQH